MDAKDAKVALIMIYRAECSGEEAENVAKAIKGLKQLYETLSNPPIEDEDGND